MPLFLLLLLVGSCTINSQEPAEFPLSLSPILFDTCPFEERLDAFTPNGSLFVVSRWSRDVNAPSIQSSLLQWGPAPIQPRAASVTQIAASDAFFQTATPAADFTLNVWSAPTDLKPSPLPNRSLVIQFARRDFSTATLSLSEWTFASARGVLNPLNIFGGSNNFTDPLPYEPWINSQSFQPIPQPRNTPSAADLAEFAPVADIAVSNAAFTHLLVQSGNSLKLLSYDISWKLLRKSVIIPALGTKRGSVERVQVLTDYRVSMASDDTTGGVWIALSMESPQFMSAIAVLLNTTIGPSAKPTALFWVPPPSGSSSPTNSSVDMRFVTAVSVPGCQAVWSTVYAFSNRIALTGPCTVNSSFSTQHLWVADVHFTQLGAPSVARVSPVVNHQINWDHRSRSTLTNVNDVVFVDGGSKLLVVGEVGFEHSTSGATVSPGDAFAALYDLSLDRELVQTRWGTSRNNVASRLLFLPRNASTPAPPGSYHTAPLTAAFPFRVLVPATINGPTDMDSSLARFSFGVVYELLFEDCSAVSSSQCVGPGRSVVPISPDQSCPSGSSTARGLPVGIIVGGAIGGFVAVAFMLYIAYRLNHVFGHTWAVKRAHHTKTKRRQGVHLMAMASEELEVTEPVLSSPEATRSFHTGDAATPVKEKPAPIVITKPESHKSPAVDHLEYQQLV